MDQSLNTCLPSSPCPGRRIWSVDDIRRANDDAGKYYFSPDTMRFFKSRIGDKVHIGPGGIYFVSSERVGWESPRLYTVRKFDMATCTVETVGKFQAYQSNNGAHYVAAKLARTTPAVD